MFVKIVSALLALDDDLAQLDDFEIPDEVDEDCVNAAKVSFGMRSYFEKVAAEVKSQAEFRDQEANKFNEAKNLEIVKTKSVKLGRGAASGEIEEGEQSPGPRTDKLSKPTFTSFSRMFSKSLEASRTGLSTGEKDASEDLQRQLEALRAEEQGFQDQTREEAKKKSKEDKKKLKNFLERSSFWCLSYDPDPLSRAAKGAILMEEAEKRREVEDEARTRSQQLLKRRNNPRASVDKAFQNDLIKDALKTFRGLAVSARKKQRELRKMKTEREEEEEKNDLKRLAWQARGGTGMKSRVKRGSSYVAGMKDREKERTDEVRLNYRLEVYLLWTQAPDTARYTDYQSERASSVAPDVRSEVSEEEASSQEEREEGDEGKEGGSQDALMEDCKQEEGLLLDFILLGGITEGAPPHVRSKQTLLAEIRSIALRRPKRVYVETAVTRQTEGKEEGVSQSPLHRTRRDLVLMTAQSKREKAEKEGNKKNVNRAPGGFNMANYM